MKAGTTKASSEGRKISRITPDAVIMPPFHIMMVVTSPIGEKAPPALAAMITIEAYQMRSRWSLTSLRSIIIITMEVVRLSSTAERISVMKPIFHSSAPLLLDFSTLRTKLNPPYWSTTSTMVMAPMRKNSVVPASPRFFSIVALSNSVLSSVPPMA